MFNNLTKLFDLVFKSLAIAIMVFTITVVIISVKSCSSTMNAIDQSEHNIQGVIGETLDKDIK